MTQTHDLKPCPFCGHTATVYEGVLYGHYIECNSCDASLGVRVGVCTEVNGEFDGYGDARRAWNTRVTLKVSDTMIEDIISEVYDLYNQAGNHWISDGALEEMSRRILSALEGNNND